MTNACFDEFLCLWERGQIKPTNKVLIRAVQNYANHKEDNIIVVDEVMSDVYTQQWQEFIAFMHKAGLKKFFFGERSTACLDMMTTLLSASKDVHVKGVTNLVRKDWHNNDCYITGLLIEIPQRRA